MPTLADVVDVVVGGDTHVDTVTLCMVSAVGAVIEGKTFDNDPDGHADAIGWVLAHAPGPRVAIGLEGTRAYGIGLTRAFQQVGLRVVEVTSPKRADRGRRGKSDTIDAQLAARKLLAMDADRAPQPRLDGVREALRLLVIGRNAMAVRRTALINQLLAVLLTGDPEDQRLRKTDLTATALASIAARTPRAREDVEQRIRRQELVRMAQDIIRLTAELKANLKELDALVEQEAPELLERTGVGPVNAAQLLVSYSHLGRCRDEAAFASLAGVSPLEASSGRNSRHRLNRGGDRQLNRAMHGIVQTRLIHDDRTKAYAARRANELSKPEIRRALKRYVAREMFRLLDRIHQPKINNAA